MEPYIYTLYDRQMIIELIDAFYYSIRLPIQILDEEGRILEMRGRRSRYCAHFSSRLSTPGSCREIHAAAGRQAMDLGEAYIFSCHANLTHVAFPLINKDLLIGSILIGPFLVEKPDSTLILEVGKHYPELSTEDLMELYDDIHDIPYVEPARVTQISRLIYFLFSGMITDAKERFIITQKKLHQQAKISESIHMYKNADTSENTTYPLDKEQALMNRLKAGDVEASKAILNDLLGYLFLQCGNDLTLMKNRSLELSAILSRAAMESGAPSNQILKLNNQFLQDIRSYRSIDDLCYALSELLSTFIECIFPDKFTSGSSRIIRDAMGYISSHFSSHLTLSEVAEYVHLNPTYLSRIFKQYTGSTFKEYLTMIRIEECKRLLQNTDFPLLDIAIATGFDDQSYFSRVFKKYTGLTPKQFRS